MRTTAAALALTTLAFASGPAVAQSPPPADVTARAEECREADTALGKAKRFLEKRDDAAALAAIEAAKNACPRPTSEYFVVHGRALARTKSWNDAVMQFHEALRLEPGSADAANGLAEVFFVSRRYEQARVVLRNAEAAGAKVDAELKKSIEEKLAPKR